MNKKIAFALILLIITAGCKKEEKRIITSVQTAISTAAPDELQYNYSGIVTSSKENPISFRVGGPIISMDLEEGDFLKKGEVIAQMDKRDYLVQQRAYEKKVEAAKNNYEASVAVAKNRKLQFQRVEELYKTKNLAKKDYDRELAAMKSSASAELSALSMYQGAAEELNNVKNQLEDTVLRAPLDGYISKKYMDEGSVTAPGNPVVSMSSENNNKVRINVSKDELLKLENLKSAVFTADGEEFGLEVATISKVKSFGKISYPVFFYFKDKNSKEILIDTEGKVKLSYKNNDSRSILIPSEALYGKEGKIYVWVYSDGHVNRKEVKGVKAYDDGMVIVEGIDKGEHIVIRGINQIQDNEEVKLLKKFSSTNKGNVL